MGGGWAVVHTSGSLREGCSHGRFSLHRLLPTPRSPQPHGRDQAQRGEEERAGCGGGERSGLDVVAHGRSLWLGGYVGRGACRPGQVGDEADLVERGPDQDARLVVEDFQAGRGEPLAAKIPNTVRRIAVTAKVFSWASVGSIREARESVKARSRGDCEGVICHLSFVICEMV